MGVGIKEAQKHTFQPTPTGTRGTIDYVALLGSRATYRSVWLRLDVHGTAYSLDRTFDIQRRYFYCQLQHLLWYDRLYDCCLRSIFRFGLRRKRLLA